MFKVIRKKTYYEIAQTIVFERFLGNQELKSRTKNIYWFIYYCIKLKIIYFPT